MVRQLAAWWLDYQYALYWQWRSLWQAQPPHHWRSGKTDKPPVVLVPGVYEPWQFMQPLAEVLVEAGYPVYVQPQLGYHTADIPEAARQVRRLLDQEGLSNVTVVAHSKGGLVGKYLLAHHNQDEIIRRVVAVQTPFGGSMYAWLWWWRTVRMFAPNSRIIQELRSQEAVNNRIVSIYGEFDPHIPGGCSLPGAVNVQLPVMGHFRVLDQPEVKQAVREWVS